MFVQPTVQPVLQVTRVQTRRVRSELIDAGA